MESVTRVQNIPIVENGIKTAEGLYNKMKGSNSLINWYFTKLESVGASTFETILPIVQLAESPLKKVDTSLCRGLDIIEQRAPFVYLPREMVSSFLFLHCASHSCYYT